MSKNKRSPAAFARPADCGIQPEDSPYAQALPLKLNKSCGIGTQVRLSSMETGAWSPLLPGAIAEKSLSTLE